MNNAPSCMDTSHNTGSYDMETLWLRRDGIGIRVPAYENNNHSDATRGAYAATVHINPHTGIECTGRIISPVSLLEAREIVAEINRRLGPDRKSAIRLNCAATDMALREKGPMHEAFRFNFGRHYEGVHYKEILDTVLQVPHRNGQPYREYRMRDGCKQTLRIVEEHGKPVAEEWISVDDGIVREYTPCGAAAIVGAPKSDWITGRDWIVKWGFFNERLDRAVITRYGNRDRWFELNAYDAPDENRYSGTLRLMEILDKRPSYTKTGNWTQHGNDWILEKAPAGVFSS